MKLSSFVTACFVLAIPAPAHPGQESPPNLLEIVQTAFDRMLNYPSVRSTTMKIHRPGGRVSYREFDAVYRKFDGKGHTLIRFTAPDYLRDSAILMLERPGGGSDSWLYRPGDRRSRRVSTLQKADAFFGSDFTFEDLEHHDWSRFALERLADASEQGRSCYAIAAYPRDASQYLKMVVHVDKAWLALLRIDFFRGKGIDRAKTLTIDFAGVERAGNLLKPARMRLAQHGRDAFTEVHFDRIETDLKITERVFTMMRLEQSGRDLYELVDRMGAEAPR